MKALTKAILMAALLATAACSKDDSKNNQAEQQKAQQLANFQGVWSSENLRFDADTCGFIVETVRTETDFSLKKFLLNCAKKGNVGTYAAMDFKLVPKEAVLETDAITKAAPEGAVFIVRQGSRNPSGWLDKANGNMLLDLSKDNSYLANRVSFLASVRDGQLILSAIKMWQGYSVAEAITLSPNGSQEKSLSEKSVWQNLKIPARGVVATAAEKRNFLYCSGLPYTYESSTVVTTLIDFKGTRYDIYPNKKIGAIGTIAQDQSNYVYTARVDYGDYTSQYGFDIYSMSLTLVGGRPSGLKLEIDGNNAIAVGGGALQLCTFLENDVFSGYGGWSR